MILSLLGRSAWCNQAPVTLRNISSRLLLFSKQPPKVNYRTTIITRQQKTGSPAQNSATTNAGGIHMNEAIINELSQKLAENKLKNILVYSVSKESGGIAINMMGIVAGVLLFAASWSTWHLFSSVRFRNRNLDNESGIFKAVLNAIGSEYFKIGLCSSIVIVGKSSIFKYLCHFFVLFFSLSRSLLNGFEFR